MPGYFPFALDAGCFDGIPVSLILVLTVGSHFIYNYPVIDTFSVLTPLKYVVVDRSRQLIVSLILSWLLIIVH